VTVFKNLVHPEFGELRTVEIDGEPWFVGKDVAAALGYTNSRDAIATHVFADDKGGGRKYRHPWRQTENDNN
jgi:prophage antirepressor-like protein